jgi:hypothetical protein
VGIFLCRADSKGFKTGPLLSEAVVGIPVEELGFSFRALVCPARSQKMGKDVGKLGESNFR